MAAAASLWPSHVTVMPLASNLGCQDARIRRESSYTRKKGKYVRLQAVSRWRVTVNAAAGSILHTLACNVNITTQKTCTTDSPHSHKAKKQAYMCKDL